MASELRQDRIEIKIGRTFQKTWTVDDSDTGLAYDPTGVLVEAEIRPVAGGPVLVRFSSNGTGAGTATWDGFGNLTFKLTDENSAGLTPISNAVWDCVITDTHGDEWPVLEGPAFITQEVTGG